MIYQRVLVPVSGKNSGERAAKALRHAKTLCSGEIILLHVTEALPNLVGGAAHTELERSNTAKAETLLSPLVEGLKKEAWPAAASCVKVWSPTPSSPWAMKKAWT